MSKYNHINFAEDCRRCRQLIETAGLTDEQLGQVVYALLEYYDSGKEPENLDQMDKTMRILWCCLLYTWPYEYDDSLLPDWDDWDDPREE